ncbi:GNAT family N-acetyltransferase [Streptomyces thermolineatus]|uniref:GNAT family N-acetyltransferase n=1 Tax=Streptomyces thermolineatus TaxID=44033 RepID=A0ABN3MS86_9ACTN
MTSTHIRQATDGEEEDVARLIATSFRDLDVNQWLVPDRERHDDVFPRFFRIIVGHALRHGTVQVTEDMSAAAVWIPVPSPEIPDYDARLLEVCGPWADRFRRFDDAMHEAHPADRGDHDHLALLAVLPGRQGHGIGTELIRLHHDELDRAGRPAYLEASNSASRRLYARHGYTDCAEPLDLPYEGERMYPMWRPAGAAAG